ncbi:MAG TPA: diguanylate cyclase [Acidimicrobiales bacterium]|nr:diguanylate cyclase [Acidimicrobiales bacterium]
MPEHRLTVGMLSPLLAGAYFGVVLQGLARHMATAGGRVVAIQTRDAQLGREYPWLPPPFATALGWDAVDGFVVVIDAVTDDYLSQLQERGKPIVLVSAHSSRFGYPEVAPDNRGGVMQAVEHLIAHGHKQIAFVGKMDQAVGDDVHERYRAYGQALRSAGLPPDPNLVFSAKTSLQEGGYGAAQAIVNGGLACTAVVAATDMLAAGLLRGFAERGVSVPDEIAVVGFDDRDFASSLSPSLSSIRVDFEAVGAEAGRVLVKAIAGTQTGPARHRVKTSFVPRESCGCLSAVAPSLRPPFQDLAASERFIREFVDRVAGRGAPGPSARLARTIAGQIATHFVEAAATCAPDAAALRRAGETAFSAFPRPGTVPAAIDVAQQLRRDILATMGYSNERLAALDRCAFELAAALYGANSHQQIEVNSRLQSSLAEEHSVSLALVGLGADEPRPRQLDWLAGTHAKTACLGIWDRSSDERGACLEIVGTYGDFPGATALLGAHVPAAVFPPVAELIEARPGASDNGSQRVAPEDVVMVLPVRTDKRYWGVLALTGQAENVSSTGADIYFQWTGLLGMALDRDSLLQDLRSSEERYELASRAANDGLWDWDVQGGTVFFSPRWKSLLGYEDHEIGAAPDEWFSRAHPDDAGDLESSIQACLRGEQSSLQIEHRLVAKDGNYRWTLCRAVAIPGGGQRAVRLIGSLTDISERKQLEAQLRKAALYDPLTGLPNRTLFMDRLDQAFARAKRSPAYQFAVLFIDLDGFKAVNDNWGHAAGDALLNRVAARLKSHLRDNDTAVRFGGDEFAVLVDGVTSTQRLDAIAERLRAKLSVPYEINGRTLAISATIGLALNTDGYEDPSRMVDDADAAMYRAKRSNRGARPAGEPVGITAL